MRRVAVLGAGPSGLVAARYLKDAGFEVTVYERLHHVGGTWNYTDETWMAEDGRPIYSSMYQNLLVNLPKEIMAFPDFPFHDIEESYVPSKEIWKYYNNFCDSFDLRKLIKFHHHVENVRPCDSGWLVTVTDLTNMVEHSSEFDAVVVCTGQCWCPLYPNVEGSNNFRGRQTHAHTYRNPDSFRNRRVLVVGAGPSGHELALIISYVAKQVFLSRRELKIVEGLFPDNVTEKPLLTSLTEYTAYFSDGSSIDIDDILYCTGYRFRFPFLSPECGIIADEKRVHPLYMHVLNINNPTMGFIGVPPAACFSVLFDLQAQLFTAVLTGRCNLPDAETMRKEEEEELERQLAAGFQPHFMANRQWKYFKQLEDMAGAKPVPLYYMKMFDDVVFDWAKDLQHFRRNNYRIIDNENYKKIY
uniref:Flavin-containing monooxygenase n=1 Tax=Zonocerus variegatus TaxID=907066 RepID=L0N8M6_9ORTH|nr:flavin-dependent monooxygenase (ZvFMOc) [Zonocerus variegatus]